ncbi:MAG: dTDP-4-dehydrorhamnose 3,5-epimerase [Gemmatimonadales bacterium]|nr:dTDP-4-dehydrorhamnose 3,5-epimerase [Gemmatimonadales bacterium]
MAFRFSALTIPDVLLVETDRHTDHRGYFEETFQVEVFTKRLGVTFVQDNLAHSRHNVLRGIHFQTDGATQGKLVRAIHGSVFDVAVDLRRSSPTFGRWVGATLSDENGHQLWIPPGFGHGYLVLSDAADVAYKVTAGYAPASDSGIRWNDPTLSIDWPTVDPVLSEKDMALPLLTPDLLLFP